eukprot:3441295-Pleurochrysis_carterae.AAC.2
MSHCTRARQHPRSLPHSVAARRPSPFVSSRRHSLSRAEQSPVLDRCRRLPARCKCTRAGACCGIALFRVRTEVARCHVAWRPGARAASTARATRHRRAREGGRSAPAIAAGESIDWSNGPPSVERVFCQAVLWTLFSRLLTLSSLRAWDPTVHTKALMKASTLLRFRVSASRRRRRAFLYFGLFSLAHAFGLGGDVEHEGGEPQKHARTHTRAWRNARAQRSSSKWAQARCQRGALSATHASTHTDSRVRMRKQKRKEKRVRVRQRVRVRARAFASAASRDGDAPRVAPDVAAALVTAKGQHRQRRSDGRGETPIRDPLASSFSRLASRLLLVVYPLIDRLSPPTYRI